MIEIFTLRTCDPWKYCWEALIGVGEGFAKFKDNDQITQEMIGSISYRYKRITRQLNTDFCETTSDTANSLYVGSYGRDTAVQGLSDLDMAFILPYAEYAKYKAFASNGPSRSDTFVSRA
jgi:Second Messenger Oligonucleotide or Dinucleotide Synthetase domain